MSPKDPKLKPKDMLKSEGDVVESLKLSKHANTQEQ
jgi:hypothetical protein